ncbi:hypothetical protein [Nesterenkonia marinintestina]|uniref:hypothetical protein n=1 Tax=Nesterenkonia marinintestina TaxID=2979865 RepID=UPI0021C11F87|nr:hypothetical protein [Nesterenkonia sp. GX14115]
MATGRIHRPRNLLVLLAAILVIAALSLVFLLRTDTGTPAQSTDAEHDFLVTHVPAEVELRIDGDPVDHDNGDTYTVRSDQVTLSATAEGFADHEATYALEEDQTTPIDFQMDPETPEAMDQLMEDGGGYDAEQEGTRQYLEDAEDAHDEHPILSDLPEEQDTFSAYQGLPEESNDDFAIHLHLAQHTAQTGREDFTAWMDEAGYDPEDYEIVETIEPGDAALTVEEPPTSDDLASMDPPSVTNEHTPEDTPEDLATQFATVVSTWDTTEDLDPVDSEHRAQDLMTEALADRLFTPENPITSQQWRAAADDQAASYPWVTQAAIIDHTQDSTTFEHTVCWAWISADADPTPDHPRTYQITIDTTADAPVVSEYDYQDGYQAADPADGDCATD